MIEQQNWWKLSSIQIGGVVCLPVIMIGQTISQAYGFASAVLGILIGNAILLMMGLIIAKMSCSNRKTTMENAIEYFGEKGVAFFALALSTSSLVWFSVQLKVMSISALDLFAIKTSPLIEGLCNLALGMLITLIVYFGIKAMEILSSLSMPLLLLTLAYAWYTTDKQIPASTQPITLGAVSTVISMAIAYAIDLPTFMRHAKSTKHGIASIIVIFVLTIPVLEIIGVYLASGQSGTILDVLKGHKGYLWTLWVTLFLIMAGWTTNNMNLYSGAVSMCSFSKKISLSTATLIFGGLGTILANFELLKNLETFLTAIGIIIASMGTVVITRYLIVQISGRPITSMDYPWHFLAWFIGVIVGVLSHFGYPITTITSVDAAIGAHVGTLLGSLLILLNRKSYEEAYAR
jgi:purine-cytosine permease-like protein